MRPLDQPHISGEVLERSLLKATAYRCGIILTRGPVTQLGVDLIVGLVQAVASQLNGVPVAPACGACCLEVSKAWVPMPEGTMACRNDLGVKESMSDIYLKILTVIIQRDNYFK